MSKDCFFNCDYDETLKKDVFSRGFLFKKKVSEEEFFGAQREYLNETGRYKILPILENARLDSINYLYSKSILSRKNNWESDFGKRVKVKAEFVEDKEFERSYNEKYHIPACFLLKVWLYDEKTGNDMFDGPFQIGIRYSFDNCEYWNYSAEYLALLIRNAINGNLQTARDIEETMQKRNLDIYMEEGWEILECDECGERFVTLNDFYCHLLEEGHYDSFLDEFPNDNETLHVKNMLKRKTK